MPLPLDPAAQPIAPPERPSRQRVFLALILGIIIVVAFFDRVNISILAADNAFLTEMGIKGQPLQIGLMMTAFLLPYGFSNVLLSPVGDYLGPRKAMLIAVSIWAVSMLAGGLAPSFGMIIASRVLLGLGEGMHYPMQSAFVKKWFPPQERGRANSVYIIGQSLAPAAAMPFFALVIHNLGWRPSFWICALASVIPLYLLWFHTADTPREHKQVNALELEHIEKGLAQEAKPQTSDDTFWVRLQSFIYQPNYWLLVVWTAAMSCISWGLIAWLPSYLVAARGFSWAAMGWLASLPFILGIVVKSLSGWLCDRAGRSAPFCFLAMVGAAAGIYFGAVITDNYASAILIAFGQGVLALGVAPAWTLMQKFATSKNIAVVAGVMNGLAVCVGALSPVSMGYIMKLTGGHAGGLYFLVGVTIVGMLTSLILTLRKY